MILFYLNPAEETLNKLLCTILILFAICIPSATLANPWKASPVFTEKFDYVVVDVKGSRYTLRIQYDGILNSYEYQTGNAHFPDNRECHYGFKRQLRRSLPEQSVVFDSALVTKVSNDQLYIPNLLVADVTDIYDFLNVISNGAISSPNMAILDYLDKTLVQNWAKAVLLKSGNNCGEMRGAIDKERKLVWMATSAAKAITEVDQIMVAIELSGTTKVFNPEVKEYREILFIYPSSIKNGHEGLVQPLIERAYTLSTLSPPPKEIIAAWLKRVREPDWQAKMWREFSSEGVQSVSNKLNANIDSATQLIEQSYQAFQYSNKKLCVTADSNSEISLGAFIVDSKQIFQTCGNGCAVIPSTHEQKKSDISAFKEMLAAKMFYINDELDRLEQIEQYAILDGEAAKSAKVIRSSAQALGERIDNWKPPTEQVAVISTKEKEIQPPNEFSYLACIGQFMAGRQRLCGNGPC
jgi:hypothetical protein